MEKNDELYCDLLLKNILNHFTQDPGAGRLIQEEAKYRNVHAENYFKNMDNRKFIRAFNEKLKEYIAYQAELEELYPDFNEDMLKRHFHYDNVIDRLKELFIFTDITSTKNFNEQIDDPYFFREFCSTLKNNLTNKSIKPLLNKYKAFGISQHSFRFRYFSLGDLEYYTEVMDEQVFIEKFRIKFKEGIKKIIANMENPPEDYGYLGGIFEHPYGPFNDTIIPMLYGYKLVEIHTAKKYIDLINDLQFFERFHKNFKPKVQNIIHPKIQRFEAVLLKDNEKYTSSGIIGMEKRKIVFANPLKAKYKVPYEALESNFWTLRKNYPDLFQETRCQIKKTDGYLDHVWYIDNYNRRGENNYSNDQIGNILNKYLSEVPHQEYYFPGLMEKEKINLNVHKIGDYNPKIVEIHLDSEIVIEKDVFSSLFWILGKRTKVITMGMILGVL